MANFSVVLKCILANIISQGAHMPVTYYSTRCLFFKLMSILPTRSEHNVPTLLNLMKLKKQTIVPLSVNTLLV